MAKKRKFKDINAEISSLKSRLRKLECQKAREAKKKVKRRTQNAAMNYARDLKERATKAESMFLEIVRKKNLDLIFQSPVCYKDKNGKDGFYIADFCDKKNKIIIEIDGEYHDDPWQYNKDIERENKLRTLGYKIYRITNADVFAGKSTQFLYNIYKWSKDSNK